MEEGRKLRQVVVVVETVKNLHKAARTAASPGFHSNGRPVYTSLKLLHSCIILKYYMRNIHYHFKHFKSPILHLILHTCNPKYLFVGLHRDFQRMRVLVCLSVL